MKQNEKKSTIRGQKLKRKHKELKITKDSELKKTT